MQKNIPFWNFAVEKILKPFLKGFFILLIYLSFKTILEPTLLEYYDKYSIVSIFQPRWLFTVGFIILLVYSITYYYLLKKHKKNIYLTEWDYSILFLWIMLRFTNFHYEWYFWEFHKLQIIDLLIVYPLVKFISPLVVFFLAKEDERINDYGYIIPDMPIEELFKLKQKSNPSITIEELDTLKRKKFAKQISKELVKIKPHNSFAIGINGNWGSGKTSLWNLIKRELNYTKESLPFDLNIMEFSPWLYSDINLLISNFFILLKENNDDYEEEIKTYVEKLRVIEKSFLQTEITDLFSNSDNSIDKQYQDLKQKFEKSNRLNIIFIDDLDRMDKEEIFAVLKLVKKLADFPNTIYILAYDREYINSAIGQIITTHESNKYLDKIIQMEFKIPEPNPDDINQSLQTTIKAQLERLKINNYDEQSLNLFFKIELLPFFIKNERDIKRFSNSAIIRYDSIHPDVDIFLFFSLNLIDYKFPDVYRSIYENKEEIISFFQSKSPKENLSNILSIPYVDNVKEIELLLGQIFTISSKFPIGNPVHFHKYFSLSLFTGIDHKEFLTMLENEGEENKLKEWYLNFPEQLLYRLKFKFEKEKVKDEEEFNRVVNYLFYLYDITKEYQIKGGLAEHVDIFNELNTHNISSLIQTVCVNQNVNREIIRLTEKKLDDLIQRDYIYFNQKKKGDKYDTDHYYHQIYSLSEGMSFKISITPDKLTDFWRFGFRFSRALLIDQTRRLQEDCYLIHIGTGNLSDDKVVSNTDRIYFTQYYGADGKGHSEQVRNNYNKEEVSIEMIRRNDQEIDFKVMISAQSFVSHRIIKISKEYQFFHMSAWADFDSFRIISSIETSLEPVPLVPIEMRGK
jgi:hypothetical protein